MSSGAGQLSERRRVSVFLFQSRAPFFSAGGTRVVFDIQEVDNANYYGALIQIAG